MRAIWINVWGELLFSSLLAKAFGIITTWSTNLTIQNWTKNWKDQQLNGVQK